MNQSEKCDLIKMKGGIAKKAKSQLKHFLKMIKNKEKSSIHYIKVYFVAD